MANNLHRWIMTIEQQIIRLRAIASHTQIFRRKILIFRQFLSRLVIRPIDQQSFTRLCILRLQPACWWNPFDGICHNMANNDFMAKRQRPQRIGGTVAKPITDNDDSRMAFQNIRRRHQHAVQIRLILNWLDANDFANHPQQLPLPPARRKPCFSRRRMHEQSDGVAAIACTACHQRRDFRRGLPSRWRRRH